MDSGFRIKLNLTEFFTDQRKYSYIFIELDKLNDFFDLERRIRRLFAITENIIFLIDNVFVPHSESIKLIHEEETLTLAAGTIGVNELGVNSYFRTSNTKSTQTKDERKRKKKVFVCQEGCKGCVHYFQTESCHVSSSQRKRKKLQSLNDCNASQNPSYPCKETNSVMPDIETVEIHGSENEMFLRVNKVYDFGRNKHADINETPPPYKKKVRFKNFKKNVESHIITEEETTNNETENNSVNGCSQIMSNEIDNIKEPDYSVQTQQGGSNCVTESLIKSHNKGKNRDSIEIGGGDHSIDVSNKTVSSKILCFDEAKVSEEKLISIGKIKSDTNLNLNHDEGKNIYFSEKLENRKTGETSASLISYNNRVNNLQINNVPVFTPRLNVENFHLDRKRTRVKTRRGKQIVQQDVSESPNITGLSAMTKSSNPETSNVRITDEDLRECINSVTDNSKESDEVYEPIEPNCVNAKADNNVENESCYSNHLSEFYSPLPTKCEAFLARIKTPNPVDIFRKILSPSVVLNRTSCNSKSFQEVTPVDEEQPIIIDCDGDEEDDTCINLEKYPLINSSPRRGDIIAFKLSKVASDCSSHTTEYIVAEVLRYSRVTSQITVKVQRGLDQLEEPQKRFSIFDEVEESSTKNDTYEFNWNELLETRLIYP